MAGEKEDGKAEGAANKSNSTATVIIGCKLPNGLVLELHKPIEVDEQVLGGGNRRVTRWIPMPEQKRYVVAGNSWPQNTSPRCEIVSAALDKQGAPISGTGYALTPGIPLSFWEEWTKQHKEADYVKNGLIFAHEKRSAVGSIAEERRDVKSGLERLDPDKLPKKISTSDIMTKKAA